MGADAPWRSVWAEGRKSAAPTALRISFSFFPSPTGWANLCRTYGAGENQKAESRKQKAESRKQKAESRKQVPRCARDDNLGAAQGRSLCSLAGLKPNRCMSRTCWFRSG